MCWLFGSMRLRSSGFKGRRKGCRACITSNVNVSSRGVPGSDGGVAGFLPAAVEAGKSRLKQIINEDCRWCRRHHCDYGLCDISRHALLVGFGQGVLFTACVGK